MRRIYHDQHVSSKTGKVFDVYVDVDSVKLGDYLSRARTLNGLFKAAGEKGGASATRLGKALTISVVPVAPDEGQNPS